MLIVWFLIVCFFYCSFIKFVVCCLIGRFLNCLCFFVLIVRLCYVFVFKLVVFCFD